MRFLSTVPLTILAALLAAPSETCAQAPVKQVEVTNFPDPQSVTGSVQVTNMPEVQDVYVANAPLAVTVNSAPTARYQLVDFTAATFLGTEGPLEFTLARDLKSPES